ncbi:glycine cleavage system aminomethyltransferase GcvT [Oscillospiraceae bacterium PP1C4]
MELKTPLYDTHVALGGKVVPFAGYLLPVQYSGVIAEHMAVRTQAGLFDVSHMGEVVFSGRDALANINLLFTNDFTGMYDGQVRYSPMCNENGGVVDDLIVYRMNEQRYLVVVNASNRHKDVAWMKAHLFGEVEFEDISDEIAQLALQGPKAHEILSKLCEDKFIPVKYYSFVEKGIVRIPATATTEKPTEISCIISKTGYTGEDGYELYCANGDAAILWNALMEAGSDLGLIPCGLGARDTLRLEAAMPLYGHEMNDEITPLEVGLNFAVKMGKDDFIGKQAIQTKGALTRQRAGLKITGRGIAREECAVFADGKQVGVTTSGTHCPYLGGAYAMAMLETGYTEIGTAVEVDVRGRRITAEVVKLPFYKKA